MQLRAQRTVAGSVKRSNAVPTQAKAAAQASGSAGAGSASSNRTAVTAGDAKKAAMEAKKG